MTVRNEAPECLFTYVVVAARRARQLMAGAPPLIDNTQSHQATRVAQEELQRGLLQYDAPLGPGEVEEEE
ncbi:MAG TPA: DNA-directed RNA polymerase subunit omega [Patescibacteria group bacterium]|nr:DNA-directed RNA polymerase subunit omega [Patescibacteria group bacterium]